MEKNGLYYCDKCGKGVIMSWTCPKCDRLLCDICSGLSDPKEAAPKDMGGFTVQTLGGNDPSCPFCDGGEAPPAPAEPGVDTSELDRQLLAAVEEEDAEQARGLLARGANADAADERGETALHRAARMQDIECCRALLEAGANPEAEDADGQTPLVGALDFAARHRAALQAAFGGVGEQIGHAGDEKLRQLLALFNRHKAKKPSNLDGESWAAVRTTAPASSTSETVYGIIGCIVLAALAVGGYFLWAYSGGRAAKPKPPPPSASPRARAEKNKDTLVRLIRAKRERLEQLRNAAEAPDAPLSELEPMAAVAERELLEALSCAGRARDLYTTLKDEKEIAVVERLERDATHLRVKAAELRKLIASLKQKREQRRKDAEATPGG